jgi:hypothetical protein
LSKEKEEEYMTKFDMIICDDGSLGHAVSILEFIRGDHSLR